jgi:HAD superfamily hydrolase (TIGR01490 family)
MSLALFDLDHTLLDGDSNTLWLDYLVGHGHLPDAVRQQQVDYLARYAAEKLDIADYLDFHLQLLTQRPLAEWLAVRADFVAVEIVPRISPAAREAVALHRAKNHRLAIITATHSFLSSAIGELFGVPVIAPRAEVRDGYLSGRIEGALCFREKKLTCLSIWMESEGLDNEAIGERYFYSDSANDLPLLEAVSHPVTVNPDRRLAVLAQQRGWPMLRWHCA